MQYTAAAMTRPISRNSPPTFADVIAAVEAAPGLTSGVRSNLRAAVVRMAELSGLAGVGATVNVPVIAKRLETITAAKLGYRSEGSLAAFRSNLRRALQIAGVAIMPGRAATGLTPEWKALAAAAATTGPFLWPAISRFAHFASANGWAAASVGPGHFHRFQVALRETCLRSKIDKTIRNSAKAWAKAQVLVPGWPAGCLPHPARRSTAALLPWSEFPSSFEQDARQFVARGDGDWLSECTGKPLKPRTQSNYLDAIRRIASLLVASGEDRSTLATLADIVQPARAARVLSAVRGSTGREKGVMSVCWACCCT